VEYIDVRWLHSNPEYPVRLVSEIGPDRYEVRKIELYLDGRVGYASKRVSSSDTRLSETTIPPLAEINAQSEFSGIEITASDFETLWDEYVVGPQLRDHPHIRAAAKVIHEACFRKPYEELDKIGLEEFNTIVAAALDAADKVRSKAEETTGTSSITPPSKTVEHAATGVRYQYKISLRFRHATADPADITLALGINPSRSWRAGDPRCTPTGRPLEGRWRDTYWTARLVEGQWPQEPLVDAIGRLLDRLAAHKDFFHQIRSQGGKVELFVGWFFNGQSGGDFTHDLLARMADLNIDLALDIYPPDLASTFIAKVAMAMEIVELHADGWVTAMDFMNALKKAIGAPDWHGSSYDAFLDSMIYHDDLNALRSPYTIRISGVHKAKPEAQNAIRLLARLINEHGASDRGGDLEVTMLVEE